jgi:hypothetical protein
VLFATPSGTHHQYQYTTGSFCYGDIKVTAASGGSMSNQHAPLELAQLGLDPSAFKYSDKKSWRGPCPQCGGSRRFVIFTDHEWPLFHGFCDECGTKIKAWERVRTKYDPVKALAIKAAQEAEERERAEYRRGKLAEFATHEIRDELFERALTQEHIDWWESQGIPEGVLKELHIGYTAEKKYYDGNHELQSSPAYTIPWYGGDFQFLTLQYRLLAPHNTADRYRFEDGLGGGGEHFYRVQPDQPIADKVIICEGAKKAIVTWLWLAPEGFTVLAASSANTLRPALEATDDCGLRFVILDPGADVWVRRAAKDHRFRSLSLPYKVDDGFLYYGLTRPDLYGAMKQARRL